MYWQVYRHQACIVAAILMHQNQESMHRIGGTDALFSKKVHHIGLTDRYRCTVLPMQIAAIQTNTATLHRSGFTVDTMD
jgi:hypothetical protein